MIPDNLKRNLAFLAYLFATCLYASAVSIEKSDSVIMRQEADAFLASLPVGLQQRQAKAVEAAIKGDYALLNEVRNARNSTPEYSENVIVKDMSISRKSGRKIPVRLYSPVSTTDSTSLPLLVYYHGGGWTFGSLNSCARFCDAVASTGKAKVLAVDYALSPEQTYTPGLLDCISAVEYAFENSLELGIEQTSISLGGDSSGGTLALATALHSLENAMIPIRSIVLFYPVIKAESDASESWIRYGKGFGLDSDLMNKFNEAYGTSYPGKNVETISPCYASDTQLKQLPPILMINAERDILASQGELFNKRLSETGCSVKHITFPGTVHLFITVNGQPTAFSRSVEETVSFLAN